MRQENINPYQLCPCGSGKKYKFCCREKEKWINQEEPRVLVRKAPEYPVYECLVNEDWEAKGMATLFVVRQLPNLKYIFGTYLVDTFCLGLKNTFCNVNVPYSTIQTVTRGSGESLLNMGYEDVRSIVFGSIEYARGLGFEPNVDWQDSQHILEPQRPFERRFKFGRNGKPVYIQGPDDNPVEIMTKLNAALNKLRK